MLDVGYTAILACHVLAQKKKEKKKNVLALDDDELRRRPAASAGHGRTASAGVPGPWGRTAERRALEVSARGVTGRSRG